MATPIWISSDGDWGNTASWSTGSVPVDGDTAVFDGINSVVSVTGSLNQAGIDLDELQTSPEYTGDIGLPGNPLRLDSFVTHRGSGSLYYQADGQINQVFVDSVNLIDAAILFGTGAPYNVIVKKGHVTCSDSMTGLGAIHVMADKAIVIVEKNGAATVDRITMTAGFLENNRALSDADSFAIISGGVYVHQDGAVSELHIHGGVVEWNADETLSFALIASGLLDFTRSGNAKTVSAVIIYPGGEMFTTSQTTVSGLLDFRKEIP